MTRFRALLGGLGETGAVPSGRAVRPEDGVLSRPRTGRYEGSLRSCLGTTIAPRRRATFHQTLLVVVLALAILPGAAAKGARSELNVRPLGERGPLVQYDLASASKRVSLPAGMLSADGLRFAFVRGRMLNFYSVPGRGVSFDAPAPLRSSVEAVAPEARYVVLRTGAQARLVDGLRGGILRKVTLRRGFTVDAMSPDGHWLYLIQHKNGHQYAVRRLNLRNGVLYPRALVEKGEQEQMAGTPAGAIQSFDGNWQFTLYVNATHKTAFVHALSLNQSYTVCIDLPGQGTPAQLRTYSLALSPDMHLFAANPALGVVADISLNNFTPVVKRFPAASAAKTASAATAPDGRRVAFSAGPRIWVFDGDSVRGPYSADANVVGLGFADARRLYAARMKGPLIVFDAVTGKRD
jgi:hypothetical protein